MGFERGEQGVGEKDSVVRDVGLEAERLKMGLDVKGCGERGGSSGEVGMEGEVAEVIGEGVVGGGREEDVLVVKGRLAVGVGGGGGGGWRVKAAVEGGGVKC